MRKLLLSDERLEDVVRASELCSREHCSRCSSQEINEKMFVGMNGTYKTLSVEEATRFCSLGGKSIMSLWNGFRKHKTIAVQILQGLTQGELRGLLEIAMPELLRKTQCYSWRNIDPQCMQDRATAACYNLVLEDVLRRPQSLVHMIARRMEYHPASFVPEDNANLQAVWDIYPKNTVTSRCLVRLDEASFGKVEEISAFATHHDGVYTFARAGMILHTQAEMYVSIHRLIRCRVELVYRDESRFCQVLTIPVTPPEPLITLHEALEGVQGAFGSAKWVLLDMLEASRGDGTTLLAEVRDRAAWGVVTLYSKSSITPEGDLQKTLFNITFRRLACIGLLYALDRDIEQLRKTARRFFQRRATKTDLLSKWENLELSINLLMRFSSMALFNNCRFDKSKDEFDADGFEYELNKSGKEQVAPKHRLAWSVLTLGDGIVPHKARIDQLLEYLSFRREEKMLFHGSADYVLELLPALRNLISVMEMLQPLNVYFYAWGVSPPNYGGSVQALEEALLSPHQHAGLYDRYTKQIWKKLNLKKTNRISTQHTEIWSSVFEILRTQLVKSGTHHSIVDKIVAHGQPATNIKALVNIKADGQIAQKQSPKVNTTPNKKSRIGDPAVIATMIESIKSFGLVDQSPKPSQWPESQVRRLVDKEKTRKAPAIPKSDQENPAGVDDFIVTPKVLFSNIKKYHTWRSIFPLYTEAQLGVKLRWDDLFALLTSEPLNFKASDPDNNIVKFHRLAENGWPAGVITLHKGHAANPKMEKHDLNNLRKDMRKEFGLTADDFELRLKDGQTLETVAGEENA